MYAIRSYYVEGLYTTAVGLYTRPMTLTTSAWRGIEKILVGRDPREAWTYTQRFCGVCTTVHAITSVRAVENALQMEIPVNAQLIRNIIQTAHAIQDHIVHFYHLSAVDWVDVVSALDADPVATAKLRNNFV